MVSPVIDLSHHNPEPDWEALKQGGVTAVMLKCTEGTDYLDETFQRRKANAEAAGLLVAPYHFFHGSNVAEQMDWFLANAKPPEGGRLVIDHETDASLSELCQAVTYLWDRRLDLQLTIYSGHTIKEQLGDTTQRDELEHTSLWIAQYTIADAPDWPRQQWPVWSLWQWTDRETVPGISQPVDGNRWNGSPEALVRFMSPSQPEPTPEELTVTMTVPEGVRLIVNGQEART